MLLFCGLSMDLESLNRQVKAYSTASPELVHAALELVERDCVQIIRRLGYNMAYVLTEHSGQNLSMNNPDDAEGLSPADWQALRQEQPLSWYLLRLYRAQDDSIELIDLVLQYIEKHPEEFHTQARATVDDYKLVKSVLVAAEALHPTCRNRFDARDRPRGAAWSYLETVKDLQTMPMSINAAQLDLESQDTPSEVEKQLGRMLSFTTTRIKNHVFEHAEMTDDLKTKAQQVFGIEEPLASSPEIDQLIEGFEAVEINRSMAETVRTQGWARPWHSSMGRRVESVVTRPQEKTYIAGASVMTPMGGSHSEEQAGFGMASGQPEKGRRFEGQAPTPMKEKTKGVAAEDIDELGQEHGSAPQSPVLGPNEPRKLIFTDRRLFNILHEIMPASTEGGRPSNVDLNDIRRLLTSSPLTFEEAVRGNTYVYTRQAQDGQEAGTVSFHGPHAGNSLDVYVLNGIRADFRRGFSWTRETFELEEAEARD